MLFEIQKSSDYKFNENNIPCKNAKATTVEYEAKVCILDENGKKMWQCTPSQKYIWTVEINSLEDLMKLKEEVKNDLIILDAENGLPVIEIYDSYRE